MEEEGGGGPRLSKRFADGKLGSGEVDFNTKAGTAWSHSYLNQKPWHPLSYPNQRRKWIAEQTHAERQRRTEEVSREFSQEQEFFRQTALISKKDKEKVEMMKAVSFMYVRPPGYNAESAKAAEIADEKKKTEQNNVASDSTVGVLTAMPEPIHSKDFSGGDKKKTRPKDVFGRTLPTEEEFEVLKNAPRLETGVAGRAKPFGVEVRNVRCVRCGTFGHQSGDRECPLKDAIMPNEENRLKRDDPLTAIMAQTDSSEPPLKWELKQRPGMSPPRGGFDPDDPNQQIVADDIFDEYGGFLSGGGIPALLSNFTSDKSKKHSRRKHKPQYSSATGSDAKVHHNGRSPSPPETEIEKQKRRRSKSKQHKRERHKHPDSSASEGPDSDDLRHKKRSIPSLDSDRDRRRSKSRQHGKKKQKHSDSSASGGSDSDDHRPRCRKRWMPSPDSDADHHDQRRRRSKNEHRKNRRHHSASPGTSTGSDCNPHHRSRRRRH